MTEKVNAVIEALMQAEEGSRDLDYAIAEALGRQNLREMQGSFAPWKYTTSLDAAMSLVPEGLDFYFEIEAVHLGPCCYAGVRPGGAITPAANGWAGWGQKHRPDWPSARRSLPLALCIAALQARTRAKQDLGVV